jgi:hypothetical protein
MPIRLVLEDYIEALGVSGDFLIDNITVYHSSVCPPLCKVCNAFDSCLACDEPAVLWRGQCLQNACSETLPKLTKDKFVPSYSFGNTYYEIALLIDLAGCFDLKLTLSGNPVVFTESKDKLTFPFGPDIIAFQCVFVQKSNEAGQYDCVFRLTISLKSTTLVVSSVSWT